MKICEVCGKEHDGSYGSGRFCSKHCRAVYSGRITVQKKRENGTLESSMAKTRAGIKYCNKHPAINSQPGGKCKFCGKECKNRNSLIHHERLCKKNPNRQDIKSWTHNEKWEHNAGKGHKGCNQYIYAKKHGLPRPLVSNETRAKLSRSSKERRHSRTTKQTISEKMKKIYRGKSRYHGKTSYAEEYFATIFTNAKRNYHVDRYFLDFAWPEKMIYIEVDGEQHYTEEKVINHDIIRTERLKNLGWTLLTRIRWSIFKKLREDEKRSYVSQLCEKI